MNQKSELEKIIALFVEAINTDNASIIPLAADSSLRGPMMPQAITGEAAVRSYLDEISPFIARMELKRSVTDAETAALTVEFEGVNGVVIEGAFFFAILDGLIQQAQFFFDTNLLIKGAK
jgi:hypothetical protein